MKINLSEYPEFKAYLFGGDREQVDKTHRKGRTSYCKLLFEFTEDDFENLDDKSGFPQDPVGLWLSNQVMVDEDWSNGEDEARELTKVERKTRLVEETYYEPIKTDQDED